ncbi:MAG: hypothetical protein SGJ10_12325 [Bacteroidota bacterium]|nr:hypothetical protein [Bacteroidota bacterium]
MKLKVILYIVITLAANKLFSQSSYILQNKVPLPKEFNLSVEERLDKAREHLKSLNIKYNDELLKEEIILFQGYIRSGQVLFNDTISYHIDKIAHKFFERDKSLTNNIKIYLCKNDYAVNFSAPDGVIFISTGFIAQCMDESQLAFAIAREIAKYQDGYIQSLDVTLLNKGGDVKSYNTYFHEFTDQILVETANTHEYDKTAMELTKNAGFDMGEALLYFDILHNAELPFEYVKFEKSFFESANFTIPAEFDIDTTMTVTHSEEVQQSESPIYDDYGKRKDVLGYYKAAISRKHTIDVATFSYMIKLAKLETCKQELLRKEYNDALYNSYCIIKQDSGNILAKEIFVQALFGFSINKNESIEQYLKGLWAEKKLDKLAEYVFKKVGITPVDTCIKILYKLKANNPNNLVVLALRKCWEWAAQNPKSTYLNSFRDYLMAYLSSNSNMKSEYFVFSRNDIKPDEPNKVEEPIISKYAKIKKPKVLENAYRIIPDAYTQTAMMDITSAFIFEREYKNAVSNFEYVFSDMETESKKKIKKNDKILQSSLDFDYLNMLKNEQDPVREIIPKKERVKVESLFKKYDKLLGGKVLNMSVEETKLYNVQIWNDEVLINDYIYEIGNNLLGYRTNYSATHFYAYQLSLAKKTPYLFTGKFTKKIYHKESNTDGDDCNSCSITNCLILVDVYNVIVPSKKFLFEYYIIDFKTGRKIYQNANDDYIPYKSDMLKAHIYDILYQLSY